MAGIFTAGGHMSVTIVDGDEDLHVCFADILEGSKTFKVSGSFSNGSTALVGVPQLRPHFVLMDASLPDLDGVETTRELVRLMPCLKVVIISRSCDQDIVEASSHAGAIAFLLKPFTGEQLLVTLRFAASSFERNRRPFPFVLENRFQAGLPLSPRETDVLAGFAEGLQYKEVSQRLGISYSAVHKHQHSIYKKLHVSNRSEAIRIWFASVNGR